MKRLVFVCKGYPTQRPGGMLHVTRDRAEALAAMGLDVHVVTTGATDEFRDRRSISPARIKDVLTTIENGVTLHHVNSPVCQWSGAFADLAEPLVGQLWPDVLHFDSFDRARPWWIGKRGRTAITMHGFGWGSALTAWQLHLHGRGTEKAIDFDAMTKEARAITSFDVAIGVSIHERWLLTDTYSIPDAKLVYNPINKVFFDAPSATYERKRQFFLPWYSGSNERGIAVAQGAAMMIGAKLVTPRDFCSVGLPVEGMPRVYLESAAVVLPTFYCQGYDLTVAESFACGRPVIVSRLGSYLREAEGREGDWMTLFTPNDHTALAEAMRGHLKQARTLPGDAADRHRPENHAANWLNAVGL